MQFLKPVLFLALFLLFFTLMALTDSSHAAGDAGSGHDTSYNRTHIYLNEAHAPHRHFTHSADFTPAHYGLEYSRRQSPAHIALLDTAGLIIDYRKPKNSLPILTVGDLFLRLSSHDQRQVALTVQSALHTENLANGASQTFALRHEGTGRFIGVLSPLGLDMQ